MGKRIELFHRKIEVKVLLEVLAVYVILALVLTGMHYLEPSITGFVTVTEDEAKAEKTSIELLNFAVVEGKWTVEFSTVGTGNLEVSPLNEATYAELYNDDLYTINDFDVLGLRCGDFEIFDKNNLIETEGAWFILWNDSKVKLSDVVWSSEPIKSVYIENYNCDNQFSSYTVRLLTEGENIQEFKFGNEIKIAGIEYVKTT